MSTVLIGLIDRIRMLDNDLIRLRSKLNTILTMRENQKKNKDRLSYYFDTINNLTTSDVVKYCIVNPNLLIHYKLCVLKNTFIK